MFRSEIALLPSSCTLVYDHIFLMIIAFSCFGRSSRHAAWLIRCRQLLVERFEQRLGLNPNTLGIVTHNPALNYSFLIFPFLATTPRCPFAAYPPALHYTFFP
ncbi:hypothetical protein VTO42DRAFT_8862 [Malbranchea cinnamomea]